MVTQDFLTFRRSRMEGHFNLVERALTGVLHREFELHATTPSVLSICAGVPIYDNCTLPVDLSSSNKPQLDVSLVNEVTEKALLLEASHHP